MTDRPVTAVETIRKARDIDLAEEMKYVYVGNISQVRMARTPAIPDMEKKLLVAPAL